MPALFDLAAKRAGYAKRDDADTAAAPAHDRDDSDDSDQELFHDARIGHHKLTPLVVRSTRLVLVGLGYSLVAFCMALITFCACVFYLEVSDRHTHYCIVLPCPVLYFTTRLLTSNTCV